MSTNRRKDYNESNILSMYGLQVVTEKSKNQIQVLFNLSQLLWQQEITSASSLLGKLCFCPHFHVQLCVCPLLFRLCRFALDFNLPFCPLF
jgi:hypothetical protein